MQTITFLGEPKSTQHIYRNTCRGGYASMYMTADGKQTKIDYQWQAKTQWRKPISTADLSVTITFYFRTKRRRDLDNQNKLILDALTGIVYEDDSQISTLCLKRAFDPAMPRIDIQITEAVNSDILQTTSIAA